ncbi:MAG: DEAD/DEAH box helicase family protein [Myxococcales bacterium]|nr:DEAD/DEAH box helicase family protein [Myxococcales bacterium]
MKLRFDPRLPHQLAAIDAVLGLLVDQPLVSVAEALAAGRVEGVVANRLDVSPQALAARVRAVQAAAGLPPLTGWAEGPPQISVEMETGTGKTYVYLRTVLELARRHGVRKAVVVVPSVAVREGVLQTLRSTREHFEALLPGLGYRAFAYDGARLGRLRDFARSSQVELMVLTLDAFNKASNRMRRPHDGFGGRTPLELLQATRPLVVLDEPQRMESPRSRAALADLGASLVLRYGATHRRHHALVHRLTPRQAHAQGLVKRIEVAAPAAGLRDDEDARISAQLHATIALHLRRQARLRDRGIKVLSLVFVPRVADWTDEDGRVRTLLSRHFDALKGEHPAFAGLDASQVCAAYFAVQRRGGQARAVDSRTGRSAADEEAYALIMRDKERLLSLEEPVSFVISHSALREGWDNPNVFQVCTLAASRSSIKKRQEVGRGIRLAVDQQGRRVHDPEVDVLTVVANDSYEDYVAALQQEDAEAVGAEAVAPAPRPVESPAGSQALVRGPAPAASVPAWCSLDSARLRADALAAVVEAEGPEEMDGSEAGSDPAAAVTLRLLGRRPPCLVSQATIEAVLAACPGEGWRRVERAVRAIVAAVQRQVPP